MANQVRVEKPKRTQSKESDVAPLPPTGTKNAVAKGKKLKEDMDRFVDEIDDILVENAEEFVQSYIQKSGE